MAQEVERILGKDEVTSSTLVSSSKIKSTSSEVLFILEMKRSLWEHEAAFANEVAYGCEVCLRHDKERFASYFAKQNASRWQSHRFIRSKASASLKTLASPPLLCYNTPKAVK